MDESKRQNLVEHVLLGEGLSETKFSGSEWLKIILGLSSYLVDLNTKPFIDFIRSKAELRVWCRPEDRAVYTYEDGVGANIQIYVGCLCEEEEIEVTLKKQTYLLLSKTRGKHDSIVLKLTCCDVLVRVTLYANSGKADPRNVVSENIKQYTPSDIELHRLLTLAVDKYVSVGKQMMREISQLFESDIKKSCDRVHCLSQKMFVFGQTFGRSSPLFLIRS